MSVWLEAVESAAGPLPRELRHLCLTLGRYFTLGSPDGSAGAFPGTRLLAVKVGAHRATVSRWLQQLVTLGWLDRELRKRQFGRLGGHYWPAVPMALLSAPISNSNGAPRRANPAAMAHNAGSMAHETLGLAHEASKLAHLDAPDSLTESLTDKSGALARRSAASPARGDQRSAAQDAEAIERGRQEVLQAEVWKRLKAGASDEDILGELAGTVSREQIQTWRRMRDELRRAARR